MLGLHQEEVRIAPGSPGWADAFEEERARLEARLAALGCRLAHVGSSAVPGLAAKPILDVAVGAPDASAIPRAIAALEGLGYEYRGDGGKDGGHVLVRESAPQVRTHHVHVVDRDGPAWVDYLLLRDYLRRSPSARQAYAAKKRVLAARHAEDRRAYLRGKDAVVAQLLGEARRLAGPRGGLARELRTPRLALRPFAGADAPAVLAYSRDPEWRRFQQTAPGSLDEAEAVVAALCGRAWEAQPAWAIVRADEVVGVVSLVFGAAHRTAELGYGIHARERGQGLVGEAVAAVLAEAFGAYPQLARVAANSDAGNRASARLLEKLGFRHEATLGACARSADGELVDGAVHGLLREEAREVLAPEG